MNNIEKKYSASYVVEKIELLRATINEAQEFRKALEQDMELGYSNFIIDLSSCEYLDSSFVGVMVVMHKKLKNQDGNIFLVKSGKFKEMIYLIAETLTLFHIFNSVEEAVSYLLNPNFVIEPALTD